MTSLQLKMTRLETVVYNKTLVVDGLRDGKYKNVRCELELEIKKVTGDDYKREWINLNQVSDYYTVSYIGSLWRQNADDCYIAGQAIDHYATCFKRSNLDHLLTDDLSKLITDWKDYHNNNLKTGTLVQTLLIEDAEKNGLIDQTYWYTSACDYLKDVGLYKHNEYSYGQSWLLKSIPEYAINNMITNFDTLRELTRN